MFVTLIVLSLAGVNNENPVTKPPIVKCRASMKYSGKTEDLAEYATIKCKVKHAKPEKRIEK